MDSNIVSHIMSKIPSRNRAYSLKQGMEMGDECLFLILDPRIHASIPEEIYGLKNLVSLIIKDIPLKKLPEGFCGFKQLKILNLLGCGTEGFPLGFNELNIEALFISDNNWEEIPKEILLLKKLKSISIINSKIKEINSKIIQLKNLEEINISNNSIKKISDNFYSLIYLKKINFSNNSIKKLSEKINSFTELKEINLFNNLIIVIPSSINDLSKLNFINFSNNKIEGINLFNLNLISILKLKNNKIKELNGDLFKLPISHLDISNNLISIIPNSIHHCKRLRHLDISSNEIDELPLEICELQQLEILHTQKNKILSFPKGILGLGNIKKIKGWASFTSSDSRKYIIPFIQHSKKHNYSIDKRIKLWDDFSNIDACSRNVLIALLNSNFRPFKKKAMTKLSIPKSPLGSEEITEIYLAGKFRTKKTALILHLLGSEISFSNQINQNTSHILLGNGKYNSVINESWEGHFVSENQLLKATDFKEKKDDLIFNLSNIESLKKLLLSDDKNIELAIQLLHNKDIPNELITILFFINISNEKPTLRIKSRNLIKNKINKDLLIYSKNDFKKENRINKILNSINDLLINKKELAYLLLKKENKGWLFVKENYDNKIIEKIKGKNILNLSNADLNKIPKEINNINSFNKLDLSNNNITEITEEEINSLDNFQEIILSNNPLKKIHPHLLQLKNLRFLYLKNCNEIQADLLRSKASWITVFR